jgi:molybdate transport system permease protein
MVLNLSPTDITAVVLSAKVAVSATLISAPFGFAAAYFLVFSRFPGKALIEGLFNLPLVLPPVVVGYLLLIFFGNSGWGGSFLKMLNISLVFTLKGAVIASAVVGFPLLVRSVRIGMETIDDTLIKAARTLGAGWWDCLMTIIFPLSLRALIAGMSLMFARSLGEFGATIIVAGNIPGVTQTIPLAIYDYSNSPGGDTMALTLCMISIVISFVVLLVSERISRSVLKRESL